MANNIISRTDAGALIPEEVANDILKGLDYQSAALNLFRRVPVSRKQVRMPIIAALPTASFINGDTGMIPTTEVNWDNKYLNIEPLGTIVIIPNEVLDDADYDMWGAVKPLVEQACAIAIDRAVFFGVNKPTLWPTDIATAVAAASNTYTRGTTAQASGGVYGDINKVFGTVEDDGFAVNGAVARVGMKAILRGVTATTGEPLINVSATELMGQRIAYPMAGQWPSSSGSAELFAGDFSQGIVGVRQDIAYTMLTEATIQDVTTGQIAFNLAQQNATGMRVIMRVGWQMANDFNYEQATEASRYPMGALLRP